MEPVQISGKTLMGCHLVSTIGWKGQSWTIGKVLSPRKVFLIEVEVKEPPGVANPADSKQTNPTHSSPLLSARSAASAQTTRSKTVSSLSFVSNIAKRNC
jgi:hypothetical protein